MAPELLGFGNQRPTDVSAFQKTDMWSLGEMTFRMLAGKPTFSSVLELANYCSDPQKFPSNLLPASIGYYGRDFIRSLMAIHPGDRITASSCLNHTWMESQRSTATEKQFQGLGLTQTYESGATQPTISNPSGTWRTEASNSETGFSHSTQDTVVITPNPNPNSAENSQTGHDVHISWNYPAKTVLQGHRNSVLSVVFSTDGKKLASVSNDTTVKVWDSRSGELLQTIQSQDSSFSAVAFSPNGKTLALSSCYRIIIWDEQSSVPLRTLECPAPFNPMASYSVAFSPDGKRLASTSSDTTIKLWDSQSGKLLLIFRGHQHVVHEVSFSLDRNRLMSASLDSTARVWDSQSGVLLQVLTRFDYMGLFIRLPVAFSQDGTMLASASHWEIKVWNSRRGTPLKVFRGHKNLVTAVAVSLDGKMLASGSDDMTIKLWDIQSGALLQTFRGHGHRVTAVAFSPDGKMLSSSSFDETVRLWVPECYASKPYLS